MAAGSIVISLLLATGSFQTDTERARKSLEKFEKQAIQTGKVIGAALAGGAVAAAALFQSLANGAAEFKDLEETTGASAENIASFAVSAAGANVEITSVADAMNKLTKNLVGVDDESKAAGAALKALGLNVDEFKKLDPAAQYDAVGKAINSFGDAATSGASKVAIAIALFGKSGAEQLRVFKDLESQGGRQTILTQRQIELADAYGDAIATATIKLKLYGQALVSDALPALTQYVRALGAVKELSGAGFIGVTAEVLKGNVFREAADGVAFYTDKLKTLQQQRDVIAADKNPVARRGGLLDVDAEIAKVQKLQNFYRELAKIQQPDLGQTDPQELARRGRGPATLPALNFNGVDTEGEKRAKAAAAEAKKAQDEINRYIEGLGKQLQGTMELTEAEKVLADIRSGSLRDAGVVAQQVALSTAEEIDAARELNRVVQERAEFRKRDYEAANAAADANAQADRDRLKSLTAGTSSNVFKQQQADIEFLRDAFYAGKITVKDYGEAVKIAMGLTDDEAKDAKRAVDELGMTFSSAFEDAIVDGKRLSDVLQALERDLIRIALRKLVIEPATNGLVGAITNSYSGSTGATADPSVGPPQYARGLDYVPYDGFIASLHKGEKVQTAADAGFERRNGSGSGGNVIVEYHGPAMKSEKRTDPDGNRRLIISVVSEDIARGGQTAQAIGGMNNRPWYQR